MSNSSSGRISAAVAAAALLCALLAPSAAAQSSCESVLANTSYWVFGNNALFNGFRQQCAGGKSSVEALALSLGANPAAAEVRRCAAEQAALMQEWGLEAACQVLAKEGLPKPAAALQVQPGGPPACAYTLSGTYKEVTEQRVLFVPVRTESTVVWEVVDGKPVATWSVPAGSSGRTTMTGVEGKEMVFEWVTGDGQYRGKAYLTFDADCRTYTSRNTSSFGPATMSRGEKAN